MGGRAFVWTVKHEHHVLPEIEGGGRCREVFTAYLADAKRSPVRIAFTAGAGRFSGDPDRGIVWVRVDGASPSVANLNTPRVAAELVRRALEVGWDPEGAGAPFLVEDGFALLGLDGGAR